MYGALFTNVFQTTGSVSSCLVADHLLELDEGGRDPVWQKKLVKESAATACVGEYILSNGVIRLMRLSRGQLELRR